MLLRIPGLGKLISAYKYVQFNGPGVVRFSGVGLILLIGVIHVLLLPWHYEAASYLGVSFGVLFAGSLLSALGIFRGARWGVGFGERALRGGVRGVFRQPHIRPPRFPRSGGELVHPRGDRCVRIGGLLCLPPLLDNYGDERRLARGAGLA